VLGSARTTGQQAPRLAAALAGPVVVGGGGGRPLWDVAQLAAFVAKRAFAVESKKERCLVPKGKRRGVKK
jgi:hypothetical protein